jgi:nucleotide-binding universal stress UspA family protein
MLVKCGVCGGHVPAEVAVDVPGAGSERYCSLRCAMQVDPKAAASALPELPRRILVAIDGSGPSLRATQMAAVLARQSGAELTLLHAIDPALLRRLPGARSALEAAELERALRAEAEAQLGRCHRLCEGAGVPVTLRIELDAPARAVSTAAADADLVVMGSRGLDAASGQAVGSLSQRLLAETRTPLLVIH